MTTFDSIILAAISAELNRTLAGGRVDKIHQPSPLDVVLTIRNNGANFNLLISADAKSPRIHLTSVKRPNPKTPPNFCMLARKYLEGARLIEVSQAGFDRILHVKFSAYDGERVTLIVEIMGKHSNVILVNDAGRILGAVKPVGRTKNRYREILPGRDYVAPPPQNKLDPLGVTKEEFDALYADTFSGDIAAWLTKTFTGISPFAARELAARSEETTLADEFFEFFDAIRAGEFMPVLISDDSGHTIGYYAFPSLQYPAANQHERTSISLVADIYYNTELPKQSFEHAKDDLVNHLRREIESREHAEASILENIVECEDAERFKQIGELILSQTASIREDASSVTLVDYYANGATIEVDLDPQLNAAENAEAYFKKYHKAVSGAEVLRERLNETRAEIESLRQMLAEAESVDSEEGVHELLEDVEARGIHVKKREEPTAKKQKPEFDGYRISKVTSNGWEILVGQNSEANDHLLTRVAKPNDLWIHVKASPSAHVVIRTNGKPDSVPRNVLYAAAELATQHSNSKHSSLVPVDYTLRKYVRKPKGAPAGKALYVNEKTIYVTPNLR